MEVDANTSDDNGNVLERRVEPEAEPTDENKVVALPNAENFCNFFKRGLRPEGPKLDNEGTLCKPSRGLETIFEDPIKLPGGQEVLVSLRRTDRPYSFVQFVSRIKSRRLKLKSKARLKRIHNFWACLREVEGQFVNMDLQ